MTRPPLIATLFFGAGLLDLIFALGLYLLAQQLRKRGGDSLPPFMRPKPVIAIILAGIGILTIIAGILQWAFRPL
jgi:uncharacterized membrane protein YidH (DUF202 family)